MEPHRFDQDADTYAVRFERTPEGWVAHIRRESDGITQLIAFPDGAGYAPDDVRGSLIAGCEAAIARLGVAPATRH